MKRIVIALYVLILILPSCAREVVEPAQQITGRYALDDGTGLTDQYLEFDKGILYLYKSGIAFPIMENQIWNCNELDYDLYSSEEYSIQEGSLFSDYYSGPIKKDGDFITLGTHRYMRLDGFKEEPYSVINTDKMQYEIPLQEGEYSFPVTVENPISVGELTASSSDNWITGLTVQDGIVLYHVSTTNTPREGIITLKYTHATDVQVVIKQSPATFIRLEETSKTIGYAATTVEIPYTIDNPVDGSELTVSSTADWCQKTVIQSDKVVINIPENNSGFGRIARLTFTYEGAEDVSFTLTQEYNAASIVLTPSTAQFDYAGGTGSFIFEVQNPREGASVTAISQANWITDVAINGSAVSYKVAENNSGDSRIGQIKLTYGTSSSTMASTGFIVSSHYSAPAIVITPSSAQFDYAGGAGSFSFEIQNPRESISCTATSQVDWITDVLVGESTVSFKITENNSWAKRTESIEIKYGDIASNVFNITQNGNIPDGTVDLGLSVLWASCNLGESGLVSSPEEYGAYYAWGETETKDNYSWSTYKFGNSSSGPFSKYNTKSSYGNVDNKTVLETGPNGDDVASKKLGGKWRMPTDEEWTALRTNCTWTWTSNYNNTGIAGRIVKSNVSGHTDKSIFLPAAGYRNYTDLSYAGSYGYYWSSSLNTDYPNYAWHVYFSSDYVYYRYSYYRYYGRSVRPVSE